MADEAPPPSDHFPVVAAAFEGALAVSAVGLGWLVGQRPLATLGWDWSAAGWGIAATLPLLAMLWVCVKSPWRPLRRIVEVLDESIVPLLGHCRVIDLAVIAALAGLGEEMLFRGVVQTAIGGWVGGEAGQWIALAAAAGLFALAHSITVMYLVLAGLIGLYLGGIWLATGNLLVPIIAHAMYDFVALVYFVKTRKKKLC
jgi:membrane protease YdiL (CAAX protease family)